MKRRLKFLCWNCSREYELTRETLSVRVLQVACPFCGQEGVVDLAPYLTNTRTIFKTTEESVEQVTLALPPVLPTKPAEE